MLGPKVSSIGALHEFRVDLKRFEEDAMSALEQASAEVQRTLDWVRLDRVPHWKHEIVRRQELVTRAKSALNSAKMMSFDQAGKSYVDERKALEAAKRDLAEAEGRLAASVKWGRRLEKEHEMFRGRVQALATFLAGEVPRAEDRLRRMADELEKYVSVSAPEGERGGGGASTPGAPLRGPAGPDDDSRTRWKRRAPGREVRKRIEIAPLDEPVPQSALLDRAARAEFGKSGLATDPAPDQDKVVALPGWASAARLLAVRLDRPALGDSGWYLGDASREAVADEGELRACRCADVKKMCPELDGVLGLPAGWAAVISGGVVEAVFDEHSRPVWSSGA